MIYQPFVTRRSSSPQISLPLRLLVLCLVRLNSFVRHYCSFIFSKNSFLFIGSLDKCHTSVFNALIKAVLSISLSGTRHKILSKPLVTFPHTYARTNSQRRKRNEFCRNGYHRPLDTNRKSATLNQVLRSCKLPIERSGLCLF